MQMQSSAPKPENKPIGSANVIIPYDFNGNRFWMAKEESVDEDLMYNVSTEPDPLLGTPDNTWHSEGEESLGFRLKPEEINIKVVLTLAKEDQDTHICTELYNSGTMCHISPYKINFTSYISHPSF